MSGFEHYIKELAGIDHEIAHWATVCRIAPGDIAALQVCRATAPSHDEHGPLETLRGLLLLRLALEAEMTEQGIDPPPYRGPGSSAK